MSISRRHFLGTSALGAGALAVGCAAPPPATEAPPAFLQGLTPMTSGIVPISDDERRARIAKAQQLMEEQRLDAMLLSIDRAVKAGHLGAVDRALRISESRRKLLGLDATTKNTNLNIDLNELTDEQLERIASGEDPAHVLAVTGRGGAASPAA